MNKFYVTTAIPYANAAPHIGTALDFVCADTLARYHRLRGANVLLSTGTDEHGTKIAEKAAELGMTPQELVDKNSQAFVEMAKRLNMSNDRFIRTTDKAHEQRSQIAWENLSQYIYKNKYVGMYCVGCEEFVTETTATENEGSCPIHNRPYEKLEEENYFFALSKFTNQIEEAIKSGTFRVVPDSRKHEILKVLDGGLDDISISRPAEKLSWGIPVPNDPKQVMYVWFEAVLNYITVLGYPENEDFKTFWPADVQVIGKDIIRFHAAIWPGILLGLGLPLPKLLYVHGFINVDGKKMSKSLGNVVSPNDIIDKYGTDAFRYYFLRHVPSYNDGDFSWERMEAAYNNELANELGNAVSRIAAMIGKYQNNIIGEIPPAEHDIHEYEEAVAHCKFDRALDEVWEQVRGINQYIDTQKPWEIAKTNDPAHLQEALAYAASCLLEIADLLEPFMPETAHKIQFVFKEGIIRPLETSLFPKHEA